MNVNLISWKIFQILYTSYNLHVSIAKGEDSDLQLLIVGRFKQHNTGKRKALIGGAQIKKRFAIKEVLSAFMIVISYNDE